MKKQLAELLICPACLPGEIALAVNNANMQDDEIEYGTLTCPECGSQYPIIDGIANFLPDNQVSGGQENKYETAEVVSSYLWSHFSDLTNDPNSSNAYTTWANQMKPHGGLALDAGCAVGRFAFEMSGLCDFAIGIDTSVAFINAARKLMRERKIVTHIKDEGLIRTQLTIELPEQWISEKVEFIVADALKLPFRHNTFGSSSSLNLVDKVPSPGKHLQEINRVTREHGAQFLLSDPFSWSTEAAQVDEWLGGKHEGPFAGKGLDNIAALLTNPAGVLLPPWRVSTRDKVWWKIRTHTNHYELIQSCFLYASR